LLNQGQVYSPGFHERDLVYSPGFHERALVYSPGFHKRGLVYSHGFHERESTTATQLRHHLIRINTRKGQVMS
jgi:hypothetical protein